MAIIGRKDREMAEPVRHECLVRLSQIAADIGWPDATDAVATRAEKLGCPVEVDYAGKPAVRESVARELFKSLLVEDPIRSPHQGRDTDEGQRIAVPLIRTNRGLVPALSRPGEPTPEWATSEKW